MSAMPQWRREEGRGTSGRRAPLDRGMPPPPLLLLLLLRCDFRGRRPRAALLHGRQETVRGVSMSGAKRGGLARLKESVTEAAEAAPGRIERLYLPSIRLDLCGGRSSFSQSAMQGTQ